MTSTPQTLSSVTLQPLPNTILSCMPINLLKKSLSSTFSANFQSGVQIFIQASLKVLLSLATKSTDDTTSCNLSSIQCPPRPSPSLPGTAHSSERRAVDDLATRRWSSLVGSFLGVLISLLHTFNAVVSTISRHDEKILYKSLDSAVSSLTAF